MIDFHQVKFPSGQWYFRSLGAHRWHEVTFPAPSKQEVRLRWKRGKFFVYESLYDNFEFCYRWSR